MPKPKPVHTEAPTEPIWWLRALPYANYRGSNWWRRRRDLYKDTRELHDDLICDLCGITHIDSQRLGHPQGRLEISFNIHHTSYTNLGAEPDADLSLVCPPCHNLIHRPDSVAAKHWIKVNEDTHPDLAQRASDLDPGT